MRKKVRNTESNVVKLHVSPIERVVDDLDEDTERLENLVCFGLTKDDTYILYCTEQDITTLLGHLDLLKDELINFSRGWFDE